MLVGLQGEEIMKIIVGGCKIISEHKYSMITSVNSHDFKCPHNQCETSQVFSLAIYKRYTHTHNILFLAVVIFYCWLNQVLRST